MLHPTKGGVGGGVDFLTAANRRPSPARCVTIRRMVREVFYKQNGRRGQSESSQSSESEEGLTATVQYDEARFGTALQQEISPWNIAVQIGGRDMGRVVGFEGAGATILAMHHLKPDAAARRGCEITVFRMADELIAGGGAASLFSAFERWLLKRGWRGNIVKKLKFTAAEQVQPIRRFWLDQGFELVPYLEGDGGWDEHIVKRWR